MNNDTDTPQCEECDDPITDADTPVYGDDGVYHMGCDIDEVIHELDAGEMLDGEIECSFDECETDATRELHFPKLSTWAPYCDDHEPEEPADRIRPPGADGRGEPYPAVLPGVAAPRSDGPPYDGECIQCGEEYASLLTRHEIYQPQLSLVDGARICRHGEWLFVHDTAVKTRMFYGWRMYPNDDVLGDDPAFDIVGDGEVSDDAE